MAQIVGTDAARSHRPNPISSPTSRAISAPSGLAAIAVSHNADDRLRLAMPEYIKNAPSRRRSGRFTFAPAASASETASGIQHAGARGAAGKRRRDHRVEQEDRIRRGPASIGRTD